MTGYDFHPEARVDLDEIWEFIRADNLDAADRVIAEILAAIRELLSFPNQGHQRPDLTLRPIRFTLVREYLIAYAQTKSHCGLSRYCTDGAARAYGRNSQRQRINPRSEMGRCR